jgi:hypothetical protein
VTVRPLIEILLREGKAWGSEEGKLRGSDRRRGKYLSRGFTAYDRNFNMRIGRAACKASLIYVDKAISVTGRGGS